MCRYDGDWEGPAFCSDVQRKARNVREHVEEYGVREYGFGLARLVVLAGKKWTLAGSLTEVPAIPAPPRPTQERTTHE